VTLVEVSSVPIERFSPTFVRARPGNLPALKKPPGRPGHSSPLGRAARTPAVELSRSTECSGSSVMRSPSVVHEGGSWRVEFPSESGQLQKFHCASQQNAARFARSLRKALSKSTEGGGTLARRAPVPDAANESSRASMVFLSILLALLFGQQPAAPAPRRKGKRGASRKAAASPVIRKPRIAQDAFRDRESVRLYARTRRR
jgi:hypothetical protein